MKRRDVGLSAIVFLLVAFSINPGIAIANPYLAKPGEPTVRVRIGACAVTGGFIHLYSAQSFGSQSAVEPVDAAGMKRYSHVRRGFAQS